MIGVIYARYSSDGQREESIDAQVRACRDYADKRGIVIRKVYADEAISGKGSKTKKRAQYQKMMRDAENHQFDVVLIHKYDRVARNVQEHVNIATRLSAARVEIIAVDQDFGQSKEAKLMKVLSWALSEFYVDNLADETRKGHKENALKAIHNGGVPVFGLDVIDKQYVINPLEAHYVNLMGDYCLNGTPYSGLIAEMQSKGIKGKRGKPIGYPEIYEILRNEKIAGVYTYTVVQNKDRDARRSKENAIRIESAIPAIMPHEKWERIQEIMDKRKNNGRKTEKFYLLSGLIYCGECGAPMHCITTRRKKGGKEYQYQYYYCSQKCGAKNIPAEKADSFVIEYMKKLASPENRKLMQDLTSKYKRQLQDAMAVDVDYTKKEIADRQKQIENLMDNLSAGVLPPAVLERTGKKIEELQSQIELLQAELDKPMTFSDSELGKYFDAIADIDKQTPEMKQKTARFYIDRVQIKKNSMEVTSTFMEFLGNHGCGGAIPIFPKHFFGITISR